MDKFKIVSKFKPTGDQPKAIESLTKVLNHGKKFQTLLGVTGSGKTFTMANVIQNIQKPTLIISHNKTLAAQLASEFKEFFPNNFVGYFVSYYDYYQPEAYIPSTDTYIGKETSLNEEIEKLRYQVTANLLSRKDVIIVASVSAIYGLGSPEDYEAISINFKVGEKYDLTNILKQLTALQYERNDTDAKRGTFRVKGDVLDIFPSYEDTIFRVEFSGEEIERLSRFNPITLKREAVFNDIDLFPAKHFVMPESRVASAIERIKEELETRVKELEAENNLLAAQRLRQRTEFDLEMLKEAGYVSGIENYSFYLSGEERKKGDPQFTLIDYFLHNSSDYLLFIDESHITVPQIGGMYAGDRARKQTLVDYGFRLPSALENRPLKFNEFEGKINQAIFVSATPSKYEFAKSTNDKVQNYFELYRLHEKGKNVEGVVEQAIRPTGILDPEIEIRPAKNQIDDAITQIQKRIEKKQRILVTTLTKRMAEDLAEYLIELDIKVHYLHSDIETLKRLDILRDFRAGVYDVVVGINLLREGLDLPEVSLVLILDADKEGFLRSATSLIQTIGRAARHIEGKAIIYADNITKSIKQAVKETERRRKIQHEYNLKHNITPTSIQKDIKAVFAGIGKSDSDEKTIQISKIPKDEITYVISKLKDEMNLYAEALEFEKAAKIRDQIKALEEQTKKSRKI